MNLAGRLSGIGNVITAGLSIYQNAELSTRTQAIEQSRHEKELELLRQQHRSELITAKQTYLISTFTDIEQYCQELNENLVNSTKDAERDMVDQRSQQFQTILLAGTIMITSVINILIQGPLPLNADEFSKIAYSLTNTGSIVFIGLNMLLCIQLIYRVTQFMYRRSEANLTHLAEAMNETKMMMGHIRGDAVLGKGTFGINNGNGSGKRNGMDANATDDGDGGIEGDDEGDEVDNNNYEYDAGREEKIDPEDDYSPRSNANNDNNIDSGGGGKLYATDMRNTISNANKRYSAASASSNANRNSYNSNNGAKNRRNSDNSGKGAGSRAGPSPLQKQPSNRSHISTLSAEDVDTQWQHHEAEVHTYLHRRSAINERRELLRFGAVSFEHFWNKSCRDSGFLALVSFYIGTSLMLLATMVFLWNQYVHVYSCRNGAVVAVITIGMSLIICIGFAIYLRFFDPTINHMRDDTTALASADNDQGIKYD